MAARIEFMLGCLRAIACSPDAHSDDALSLHKRDRSCECPTCCLQVCWASAHAQRCVRDGELQLEAFWANRPLDVHDTHVHTYEPRIQAAYERLRSVHTAAWVSFGALATMKCFAVAIAQDSKERSPLPAVVRV